VPGTLLLEPLVEAGEYVAVLAGEYVLLLEPYVGVLAVAPDP